MKTQSRPSRKNLLCMWFDPDVRDVVVTRHVPGSVVLNLNNREWGLRSVKGVSLQNRKPAQNWTRINRISSRINPHLGLHVVAIYDGESPRCHQLIHSHKHIIKRALEEQTMDEFLGEPDARRVVF